MSPAYRQMLAQVVRDRCARGLLVRLTWFIAACIVAELMFAAYFGQPRFGRALLILLTGGTGYMWCGAFLKSAARQNQPAYACLVPGLRRRLMTLTALLFTACALASAALAALLLGHGGYALVLAGLFSVYILFAHRYPGLNFLPSVAIVYSSSLQHRPLEALFAAANAIGEPAVAGVGLLMLLVLGMLGVRLAFPQGGDHHWAWHRRLSQQQARLSGAAPAAGASAASPWTAWMRRAYFAGLRRDSRGGATQGRMMAHALGTTAHDGNGVIYLLVSTLAMVLVGLYVAGRGDPEIMRMSASAMQGCVLMASLMYAVAASAGTARHGVEQGLYRLTPAAPATSQLNRVLARTLLFRCLRLWLLSLAGAVCIDVAIFGGLRGVTYALAMLTLPFAGLTLRNYAAMQPRTGETAALAATLFVVLAYIAALMMASMLPAFPWFWAGSAVALASAVGLVLGWRRMLAAPPALPAGRLS